MASPPTARSLSTDGSYAAVTGSTVEGAGYARHMAGQRDQDIDIMVVEGSINSSDTLMATSIPGFVQVKFDGVKVNSGISLKSTKNQEGVPCVNGFEMKKTHCKTQTMESAPLSYVTATHCTSVDSASVATELSYQTMEVDKELQQQLANISNISEQHKQNYPLVCNGFHTAMREYALPLCNNSHTKEQMSEWNFNIDNFRDALSLTGPAYGYRLSQINKDRMIALLNFYQKHKQLGNAQSFKDRIKYEQASYPKEGDIVPCFQLDFWPNDVQSFRRRLEGCRPALFQLIESSCTSMHVIPKWSTKTPEVDAEIEFRYSFSFIERLLAGHRSKKEQTLNGIARSIYYGYLKNKCKLPSYFIKTSVFWMCEQVNMNDCRNDQEIAQKWCEFACKYLEQQHCSHYFIENLNILERYSKASLDEARHILMNEVNLEKSIRTTILDEQLQLIHQLNKNNKQFMSQIKVKDLLGAISDYHSLRENWPHKDEASQIPALEDEMTECLDTLNMLRFIDGDDLRNWSEFRCLFLEEEALRCTNEPLWGESTSTGTPADFVVSLQAVPSYLKGLYEAVTDPQFTGRCIGCSQHDLASFQNVIHDLSDPAHLMQQLLARQASWLRADSKILSSLMHRTVIDSHPDGPQLKEQRTSHAASDKQGGFRVQNDRNLLSLLQSAPDENMTIGELLQHQTDAELQGMEDELVEYIKKTLLRSSTRELRRFIFTFIEINI